MIIHSIDTSQMLNKRKTIEMKQKIILLLALVALYMTTAMAQNERKQPHLSKEEYQQKLATFITEHANLSEKEAKEFFPIYNNCQEEKHRLNDKIWELRKKARGKELSNEEYKEILEKICQLRMQIDQLDKDYLTKYNEVLSYKQIFTIQGAEAKFHREMLKRVHSQQKKRNKN